MSDIESEHLAAHVSLCQERYKQLDNRLEKVEKKVDELRDLLTSMRLGFNKALWTSAGSIIVAIIGAVALYFSKH